MENKQEAKNNTIIQCNNVKGRTIHEKRKNLFVSLYKLHVPKHQIPLSEFSPNDHIANVLRIEVLLHLHRTDDLIQELQTRNDFSLKIVKNRNFCENFARKLEQDPWIITSLLPRTSFVAKTALFKNLAKNSSKLDGVFEIVLEKYGLSVAQHMLPSCSKARVDEILKSLNPRLTPKQLRLLYKNHLDLFKWYLNHAVIEDRTIWSFLAKENMALFSEMALEKLDEIQVKLGQNLTKKLVQVTAKSKLISIKCRDKVHWKTVQFLIPETREIVKASVKDGTKSYLDTIKQLPEALGEITKKISVTRSKKMRRKYAKVLAEIAGRDLDVLAKVLKDHEKQDRDFLNGFLDELLKIQLDARHWPTLLEILDQFNMYDNREGFLLKWIEFDQSDDAIVNFMKRYIDGYRYNYAKAGKFEKTLLLACIRLMPQIKDDDDDEIFDLSLICSIFEFNKRYPKDRLKFQDYDRLNESLRTSIEKLEGNADLMPDELARILEHVVTRGNEEMLQAWSKVAEKYYSRKMFEWLLKHKPDSLNFTKFLEYSKNYFYGRPIEVDIYKCVKQHPELAREAKAFFLEKKCEIDDWDYRKKVLVIMALLMEPEEFGNFIKIYPPTKYKWFDDEGIILSLRYTNNSSMLLQLLNFDELCNEQAIESLCFLHLHLPEDDLVEFQPLLSQSKLKRYGMVLALPTALQQLPTVKASVRVLTKTKSIKAWDFLKTFLYSELMPYDTEAFDLLLSKLQHVPEAYHVELQTIIWDHLDNNQKPKLLSLLSSETLSKLQKLPQFENLEIYGKLATLNAKASLPDSKTKPFDVFIKGFAANVQTLDHRLEAVAKQFSKCEAIEEYILLNFAKFYLKSSGRIDEFAKLLRCFFGELMSELGHVVIGTFAEVLRFFVFQKFTTNFEGSLCQVCKVLLLNGDESTAVLVLRVIPSYNESKVFKEILERFSKDSRNCVKVAYYQYLRKK